MKKRVDSGQAPLVGGLGPHGFGHGRPARPGFGFGFSHGLFGASADAAATYLGITEDQLRTELQAGKTLAQIATAHNKTADGLVAALLADGKKHLDAAVTAGRLTAAQEQSMLDKLKALLTDVVNGKLPAAPGPGAVPHAFGFGFGGQGASAVSSDSARPAPPLRQARRRRSRHSGSPPLPLRDGRSGSDGARPG